MFEQFIFYFFGAILLLSAVAVISARNPVYAALFLVLAFFSSAVIWLLMMAEFLAIVLVLVYVGAVMVLFLFVVMLLDINIAVLRAGFARFLPAGIIIAVLMMLVMGIFISADFFNLPRYQLDLDLDASHSNIKLLGIALYTEYLHQFEIAGVILLVAIVAAISLTRGKPKGNKSIDPAQQVYTKKQDRLRIVKMDTEKTEK